MFKDEFKAVVNGGVGKINFLKNNPLGYFVAAMVAGMFISFGSFVLLLLVLLLMQGMPLPGQNLHRHLLLPQH